MITDYENTLRRVIILVLGTDDGNYKVTEDRISIWKEKKENARKKSKNTLKEERLIYYSDFYNLKSIINKNWEKFVPIFHNKKRFEVFFDEMESFRNEIAHGRDLTSSQENMIAGILNDLKTLIAIYHNKNEMKDDYFIKVLKICDNLGNIWEINKRSWEVTLREGDYYELIIDAFDPKGRKIKYKIFNLQEFRIDQESNKISFVVDKKMVGSAVTFYILAYTPDSEYDNSDGPMLHYTILPK